MPLCQEMGSFSSNARLHSRSTELLYSRTSGSSSYSSSSSDNLSSIESPSSSSAPSSSRSARLGNRNYRSDSPNLLSRQEGDFIMVDRAGIQQKSSGTRASPTPPQLPPTGNRAPLNRPGSNTPPPNTRANMSLKQKAGPSNLSGQNKGSLTPPLNRPLPKIPNEEKDSKNRKDQKVYYC